MRVDLDGPVPLDCTAQLGCDPDRNSLGQERIVATFVVSKHERQVQIAERKGSSRDAGAERVRGGDFRHVPEDPFERPAQSMQGAIIHGKKMHHGAIFGQRPE